MENEIKHITIERYTTKSGLEYPVLELTYQVFGLPLYSAPIVLVNHALTGNSNVTGTQGWWNQLIGENEVIDTNRFTIVAFNIPGNGFGNSTLINQYKDFTTHDIAQLFWKGLTSLNVNQLFAVIGGSLGGAIAWEMAVQRPNAINNLIPIASDFKSSDWLIANVLIQDLILSNSKNPVHDARIHAMLLYRTPESLKMKFNRNLQVESSLFQIESWLFHHGEKLENRFQLAAYKLMNHLLKTIDISNGTNDFYEIINNIKSNIHIVSVDTDNFFTKNENLTAYENIKKTKSNVYYYEIKSIHGHDAFLIEYDQLNAFLKPIFNS